MSHRTHGRGSLLLAVSLAALLIVIGASTSAIWWDVRNSQERVGVLQKMHMQAGVALAAIRADVYLHAVLTRDYLLDPDPSRANQYVDQFKRIQARTQESFQSLLATGLDTEQLAAVDSLKKELTAYWDPSEVIADWSPSEKRAQRSEMLSRRGRRREEIFAVTEKVEQLVTDNFTKERERIMLADRDFRSSIGWTIAISLLLGFAIAGGAVVRMLALERRTQITESELRSLSAQLRTAQEDERRYLSRELHDQVGQMLTGLRMDLAALARSQSDSGAEISARIITAKTTVEQTLGMVRNIAMMLRPSMLDDLGLSPALVWLLKESGRSSGIEMVSEIDPAVDRLPEAHRTCIFRVVQEGVTNASKHAGARQVSVSLRSAGGWVIGKISDDGRGFNPAMLQTHGLGLLGMEERVREIGGSLCIDSSPGTGTRLEFRLPYAGRREPENDSDINSGRPWHRTDGAETPSGTLS